MDGWDKHRRLTLDSHVKPIDADYYKESYFSPTHELFLNPMISALMSMDEDLFRVLIKYDVATEVLGCGVFGTGTTGIGVGHWMGSAVDV